MPILIARRIKLALGNQLSIKRNVCGLAPPSIMTRCGLVACAILLTQGQYFSLLRHSASLRH
jgi:hypothetical protein